MARKVSHGVSIPLQCHCPVVSVAVGSCSVSQGLFIQDSCCRSWVNLYCVLNKGELGFYKDAKNTSTPYNNEALISLNRCACDINNGYKKKKNVFTLKTKDGSEYLFHAKDEDDLKSWITSINSSISEHEEMGKCGQTHLTTSSTDEGTRREGSRAGGSERGEKSADGTSVRSDKGEKPEKKIGKKK
ncbi:hypothetical protein DNTS_015871 [Danionella cerebrum]|uniref:PH domain-containing protein n=1 Tax=Danionella cerebrum TaxID=2873325 RepID=A0A553N4D3_9TELE|nr:hypothetical protein DNTS_015871 [Danionella translucida]